MATYGIECNSKHELEITQDDTYDDDEYSRSRYSRDLSPKAREGLRLRVNARERERMHDINGAMDALRQVSESNLRYIEHYWSFHSMQICTKYPLKCVSYLHIWAIGQVSLV